MSASTSTARATRAFAAVMIASSLVSGPFAASAVAEPATAGVQQQAPAPSSTVEEKVAALRQIGLPMTPEVAQYPDQQFVIHVWQKADDLRLSRVRDAAARAFTEQSTDPDACYTFIVRGLFEAHRADLEEALRKAERDRQRVMAADAVGWTGVARADLDSSLKEFVFRLWERAEPDSQVRAKAEAVLTPTSTDEQRLAYVVTDIFVARDADRENPPR